MKKIIYFLLSIFVFVSVYCFAKEEITKKILETFEGAFLNDKEIRIPWIEDGQEVQIKFSLVCAKENIASPNSAVNISSSPSVPTYKAEDLAITEEEKKETLDLLKRLNL